MGTGVGTPAITNPRPNDWRGLQNAISAIIQRFQNDEALLAAANSTATATANSTTGNLNSILSALQILQIEVNALQNAQITDIESFVAGEAIAAGQVIVPLSANTVGVADPNDTARIFGVLGIATGPAAPAAAVLVQRSGVYTFTSAMGFQVGRAVYCDTLGGVTQMPSYDAVTIPLGVAVSANAVFVDPDSPALLQPTFSSGFENPFEDYLPATYALIKTLGSLESLIAALPYQSGADLLMEVPVLTDAGNVAVRVTVADIVALASSGGLTPIPAGDLLANLTGASAIPIGHPFSDILAALSTQSSAERLSLVPVLIGGNAVMCTAEDIASLANLSTLIAALPYSSGLPPSALVPVDIGGVAVLVTAEDIAALGVPSIAATQLLGRPAAGNLQGISLGTGLRMSGSTLNVAAATPGDPNFASVTLLLNYSGIVGGNAVSAGGFGSDLSSFGQTLASGPSSTNGIRNIQTQAGLFPTSWDASSGTMQFTSTASLIMGTGDFTAEMWIYFTTLATLMEIFGQDDGSATSGRWFIGTNTPTASQLAMWFNGSQFNSTGTGALVTGKWTHIAYNKTSNVGKILVDGVALASGTDNNNYSAAIKFSTARAMTGGAYISQFRLTKGVGRYPASFVLSAAAFPTHL